MAVWVIMNMYVKKAVKTWKNTDTAIIIICRTECAAAHPLYMPEQKKNQFTKGSI